MKVLITGGAGFIGQRTGELLLKQGHQLTILDNLSPPAHDGPPALPAGMDLVEGDVRKREDWVKALKENEVVLHLADHHDYLPSFSKLFHVNAVGTAILFELLLEGKTSVRRVVLGSSMAVYGEGKYRCGKDGDVYPQPRRVDALERGIWDPPCPICGGAITPMVTDESVARPTSAYGLSKLAQEELVRLLGERHGIEWIILRYGAVQGRAQPFQNAYYGALRIFALRLAHNQAPQLLEDGNQLRDFVDVDDVARANAAALAGLPPGAYNVASGRAHTVMDLARILLRVAERDIAPETPGRYRVGDARHSVPDVSRMKAAGWEAQTGLEAMAREYWQWLTAQPNLDTYFEGADHLMERTGTVRVAR
ncbi:MAG TPA: NAD-dependent epimerase/dehydratase family protein [Candidatus Binatus sp.]|jgi:dTDP-L-rhamnose 4-epimerase|nr:NAD-dependent epimerase/dehydratase family protein [Candidatus Binatus sp.]